MVLFLDEGVDVPTSHPTSGTLNVQENVQAALERSMRADPGVFSRAREDAQRAFSLKN